MKFFPIVIAFCLLPIFLSAQIELNQGKIGIGTITPEKDVHIEAEEFILKSPDLGTILATSLHGNVGIGISNAGAKLDVEQHLTGGIQSKILSRHRLFLNGGIVSTNQANFGMRAEVTATDVIGSEALGKRLNLTGKLSSARADGSTRAYQINGSFSTGVYGSTNPIFQVFGSFSDAALNNSAATKGDVSHMTGAYNRVLLSTLAESKVENATGTIGQILRLNDPLVNHMRGTYGAIDNRGGGTINNAVGSQGYIRNRNGDSNILNAAGIQSIIWNQTGTINNINAFSARITTSDGGTSQNAKLFYGNMQGNHDTEYGLYLIDQHPENVGNGNITMKHYLEGNVGLGTTEPESKLHIVGGNVANQYPEAQVTGYNGTINIHSDLSQGMYNPIVRNNDLGIIFTRPASTGSSFVLAPWNAKKAGVRIDENSVTLGQQLILPAYNDDTFQAGSGNYTPLVVDGNGNVFKAPASNNIQNATDNTQLNEILERLDQQEDLINTQADLIEELSQQLTAAQEIEEEKINQINVALENSIDSDAPFIAQNIPNPTASEATIKYFVPEHATNASIRFFSLGGQIMKDVSITQYGKGEVKVDVNKMVTGNYMYALIVDGELIDTKKMAIIH